MLPESEGDCQLHPAYDLDGKYKLELDPFYKDFVRQYECRDGLSLKKKKTVSNGCNADRNENIVKSQSNKTRREGESFEEYIERRIMEPRDEYRELGTFYEKPEGSDVLSTTEVAERGVTAEEIDALLVELGYIDEDVTAEVLYLILYDREFCEELINEIVRSEEQEEKAFDLEYEEMYDKHVRKLFRFKDME